MVIGEGLLALSNPAGLHELTWVPVSGTDPGKANGIVQVNRSGTDLIDICGIALVNRSVMDLNSALLNPFRSEILGGLSIR
jgi:hypothetical protein